MPSAEKPRRRDSDATAATEIAACNSTINRFLGGRRKSWMTEQPFEPTGNLHAPPHPTVRPNFNRKTQKLSLTSKDFPQPLSTSTSPQLANASSMRSNARMDLSTPINVLPSPAPSEEESGPYHSVDPEVEGQGLTHIACGTPGENGPAAHNHSRTSGAEGRNKRPRLNSHPISHQAVVAPSVLPLEHNLSLITDYISSIGGEGNLTDNERLRISLLKQACICFDYTYITLHQLLCLSSTSPQQLPRVVRNLPNVGAAWDLLNQLLVSNEQFLPRFIEWASTFPGPLSTLADRLPSCNKALNECLRIMQLAPSRWQSFSHKCQARGYPSLVTELVIQLGITSQVLQLVAFTALRRSFCVEEDVYAIRADELFRANQASYIAQSRHPQGSPSVLADKMVAEESKLAQEYQTLFKRCRQAKQPSVCLLPSNAAPLTAAQPRPQFQVQRQLQPRPPGLQAQGRFPAQPHMVPSQQTTTPSRMMSGHPAYQAQQPHHPSFTTPGWMRQSEATIQNAYLPHAHRRQSSTATVPSNGQALNANVQFGLPISRPVMPPYMGNGFIQGQRPPIPMSRLPPPQLNPNKQALQLLLPPPGYRAAQPAEADPATFAMHQAHLRSPMLGPLSDTNEVESTQRLYQCVNGFALAPQKFDHAIITGQFSFRVSPTAFAAIPRDVPSVTGHAPSRTLDESHRTYRLRCVKLPPNMNAINETAWVMTETHWPVNMYFEINSVKLQPRRKLHYGKDLPIDVSQYIVLGMNVLKVFHVRRSTDQCPDGYACAVEAIDVLSHQKIISRCTSEGLVPAPEILQPIKASLSTGNEDEDIAITSSNITIGLRDPISGCNICDVPVRGKSCKHQDCFDLSTFLASRNSIKPTWPSIVDCWKCPICKGDVRPQSLMVDGLLTEVRDSLAQQGLLRTRAIVVESDGSWKPKVEKKDDSNDRMRADEDCDGVASSAARPVPASGLTVSTNMEVIDLEDS